MSLIGPYLTVEEFKARIGMTATDAALDSAIENLLLAVSQQMNKWCGRFFGKADAPFPMLFSAETPYLIWTSDFVSVSELASDDGTSTFGTIWEIDDYSLLPYGAVGRGEPYHQIQARSSSFPAMYEGVRVTATWGWPAPPPLVVEAAAIQANRLWARRKAPFGVVGNADLGQMTSITSLDPDVKSMLAGFRVMPV